MVCAIDLYAKCTLDPKGSECDKKKMPKFVFMDDENKALIDSKEDADKILEALQN